MSARPDRLLPSPPGINGEFYERAATTGALHLQRCTACATWRHPPRLMCAACGSDAWTWEPASGRGRVFTWTTTHRPVDAAFADEMPYAILVVELEEGPRVVGNLLDLAPEELRLDLAVHVVLDKRSETVALVDFAPDV